MGRICKLTGKRPVTGHNVSHAMNATKRLWVPNMQSKQVYVAELGRTVKVRLSVNAMKTLRKKGLTQFLKEQGLTLKDIT